MKKLTFILILLLTAVIVHAQGLFGSWNGKLDLGQVKLSIVFNISKDDAGKPVCTMDSPDQGAKGIPADIVITDGTKAEITVKSINLIYNGELKDGELKGNMSQNGMAFPLNLKPGADERKRPQTPVQPYPYKTEDVTFTNTADNAVLSGTLTLPVGFDKMKKTDVPVVVMVTGSGQQNRDEELFGHKPFLVLADYLARNGIASLRYDDRGFGKSTGDAANATTQNNKQDALAAVDFLRKSGRFGKVGVLGHSEGGTIAFMIAAEKKADFMVSLAGSALRGDSTLILQNRLMLRMMGMPGAFCDAYCAALKDVFGRIEAGIAEKNVSQTVSEILKKHSSLPAAQMQPQLEAVVKSMTPWMRYFISYDPSADIAASSCPVMAVNGQSDMQVSCAENLGAIRRLLPSSSKNLVKEYPLLNHLLQHCTTGSVMEYGQIEETMSPEVLKDIADWINKVK